MSIREDITSLTPYDGYGTYQNIVRFPEKCADECGELRELVERKRRTTDEVTIDYLNTSINKLAELACEHCVGPKHPKVGPWRGKSCPISGLVERTN